MADETSSRDDNYVPVISGIKDTSGDITQIRVDETTRRLLIDNDALPQNTEGTYIGDVGGSVQLYGSDNSSIASIDSSGYIKTESGKSIGTIKAIASGSVVFGYQPTNDNLAVEKNTSASSLALHSSTHIHPDSLYILSVERPSSVTYPGDLTIKTYNVQNLTGSNERNVLHTIHTISSAKITTNRDFLVQGLFVGQAEANLGFVYATDTSETMKIYYKIFKL